MQQPTYEAVDADTFTILAEMFAAQGHRRLSGVHLHQTCMPNIALFRELAISLSSGRAAGREACRRLWHFHTSVYGWSDIAQHVTVDPDGQIWLNRAWDKPPVSARGHNGSMDSGPLMLSLIGDFNDRAEVITSAQQNAAITVTNAIQTAFGLVPGSLAFHSELTDTSRCPGNCLEKDKWLELLSTKANSGDAERIRNGQVTDSTADIMRCAKILPTLLWAHNGERGIGYADSELLGEPQDSDMSSAAITLLSGRHTSNSQSRGATNGSRNTLTPEMIRQIRPHVVNLNQGLLSDTGDFTSSMNDVRTLVKQDLRQWCAQRLVDNAVPRVMIHAHGGLNSENDGLAYAYDWHRWWLKQNVYPIYFVWETGPVETALQLLEERLGGLQRGFADDLKDAVSTARDALVEEFIHAIGQDLWSTMKVSAERASGDHKLAGARLLSEQLVELQGELRNADDSEWGTRGPIEFHAVGHSAGAIFHCEFVPLAESLEFQSLSLLAPACTIEQFRNTLQPLVGGTSPKIADFALYNLDRVTERADSSVPCYSKSLLFLVSNAFETQRGAPLLGMDQFVRQDSDLSRLLGLAGDVSRTARLVLSPSSEAQTARFAAGSIQHGGFQRDFRTMRSVAMRIRDLEHPDQVPSQRQQDGSSRGARRLYPSLRDRVGAQVYDGLFTVDSVASQSGSAFEVNLNTEFEADRFLSGSRRALCIGINDYPISGQQLNGCLQDVADWTSVLESSGFSTLPPLLNSQATHSNILSAIQDLVLGARDGDVLFIHYSGHGCQFEDLSGDEDDRQDEAIVPYDNNGELFISDDELWDVLQAGSNGSHIYVFMDCCNSASNTRAFPIRGMTPRFIRPTRQMTQKHQARLRGNGVRSVPKSIESMKHIKYAACLDRELANESGGRGLFTQAATAAIRSARGPVSNHQFIVEIERQFAQDARQHPVLECPSSKKNQPILFTPTNRP